jgi:ABC-type sugar transport system ATPase subunit
MAQLQLRSVEKRYGSASVIQNLDLDIEDKSFTVLVGPSGCGKSTIMRMIAGLEEITAGDLLIDTVRMNDDPPVKRGVAMVFQNYALYPHMTVAENIAFGLVMAKMKPEAIKRKVTEAAEILKLGDLLERKPGALSGGQRQRVAIGRAIVREPRIFLFDEPLSNLDAELRVAMRVEIAKLHRQIDTTMIYVTHDQVEAMTLADNIVVLREGRIQQQGKPLEIYENPVNTFVAGFIGSPGMNFLRGTLDGSGPGLVFRLDASNTIVLPARWSAALARRIGSRLKLGFRPEHVRVVAEADAISAITADLVENLGGTRFVYCKIAGCDLIIELRETTAVVSGARLPIFVAPEHLYLFEESGERLATPSA